MQPHPIPPPDAGEVYVALTNAGPAFPAVIDDQRWCMFAQPRFRPLVATAVVDWMNTAHQQDPKRWATTGAFRSDGELELTALQQRSRVERDDDGRYLIGYHSWQWELTTPNPDITAEAELLADTARLTPHEGEILVSITIDDTGPHFPALASPTFGWSRAGTPLFRKPVAEVVVAWINDTSRKYPGSDRAYWDGDTIVLLDEQWLTEHRYLPERIEPDDEGRYAIGAAFEWERTTR